MITRKTETTKEENHLPKFPLNRAEYNPYEKKKFILKAFHRNPVSSSIFFSRQHHSNDQFLALIQALISSTIAAISQGHWPLGLLMHLISSLQSDSREGDGRGGASGDGCGGEEVV